MLIMNVSKADGLADGDCQSHEEGWRPSVDCPHDSMDTMTWPRHLVRVGDVRFECNKDDIEGEKDLPRNLDSWIGAALQAEHLALLLGNGLTTAQTLLCGASPASMSAQVPVEDAELAALIDAECERVAAASGRGTPNLEDSLRVALGVADSLRVLSDPRAARLQGAIESTLSELRTGVLAAESGIVAGGDSVPEKGTGDLTANGYLVSFLLSFAGRSPTRDRLNIFTTNYDRLIEHGCEVAGLRVLDRFVGQLEPRFRSSRVDVDLHYNPPGIRGEPRFLDGVVRLSKLHGSVDWQWRDQTIVRSPLPFGSASATGSPSDLMIYPNSAKDFETSFFPYAELFRDFSAAVCRSNSVLVSFGYSFGDDHINRVIADMLAIPSTHLLAILWDDAGGRAERFVTRHGRDGQVSVLLGPHYGDLTT